VSLIKNYLLYIYEQIDVNIDQNTIEYNGKLYPLSCSDAKLKNTIINDKDKIYLWKCTELDEIDVVFSIPISELNITEIRARQEIILHIAFEENINKKMIATSIEIDDDISAIYVAT